MPPFAAFWHGLDIPERVRLGLLASDRSASETARRAALRGALVTFLRRRGLLHRRGTREVLDALHTLLARSPAKLVLLNLEDLWLETAPLNVPGTWREVPNWRRKFRHPVEGITALPEVSRTLSSVASTLRGEAPRRAPDSR
jgi:4-alpha-glucanotransferase